MIRRRRSGRMREAEELNITAFMNLMVVLTPFLLITAVFSRTAILELNLPGPGSANDDPPPELALEITVRDQRIEIGDRATGPLKVLENDEQGYRFAALTSFLEQIKGRFPDKVDATLLVEPQVSYDTLVQVMDAVRTAPVQDGLLTVEGELFPEIAIGDAVRTDAMAAAEQAGD
jgi:biopolymer transport protein ExbD